MHIYKSLHHLVSEEVKKIDNQLMDLYDIYISIVQMNLWLLPIQDNLLEAEFQSYFTQGLSQVKFKQKGKPHAEVECQAVNFPLALHELTKSVIDYLICRGIPEDLSEEELKYYYSRADNYKNELWFYYLSPTIWTDFIKVIDKESQEIPGVISKLSLMSYQQLADIFCCIIDDKEKAKIKLKANKII
jgi:hypothetical protein